MVERPIEIRRIEPDDWTLWRSVRLRALAEDPAAFGSTLADWQGEGDRESRWRARLSDVAENLIALIGDAPVGQVSGGLTDRPDQVMLISMWVAPEARGQGVGDALIAAVLRWADHRDAAAVVLWVNEDNGPATALYRRHGFEPTPAPVVDGERQLVRIRQ